MRSYVITKRFLAVVIFFQVFSLAGTGAAIAEKEGDNKKPLWEFGLFNSGMTMPHYRGSDETMSYLVAIPYFIYRCEIFRAGRDGFKGVFFQSDRFESSLSLSGYPPVK